MTGSEISIGKAAHALGVSVDTLRSLDEQGILKPKLTGGGHRRYDREQLAAYLAAERGLSPDEARVRIRSRIGTAQEGGEPRRYPVAAHDLLFDKLPLGILTIDAAFHGGASRGWLGLVGGANAAANVKSQLLQWIAGQMIEAERRVVYVSSGETQEEVFEQIAKFTPGLLHLEHAQDHSYYLDRRTWPLRRNLAIVSTLTVGEPLATDQLDTLLDDICEFGFRGLRPDLLLVDDVLPLLVPASAPLKSAALVYREEQLVQELHRITGRHNLLTLASCRSPKSKLAEPDASGAYSFASSAAVATADFVITTWKDDQHGSLLHAYLVKNRYGNTASARIPLPH